MLSKSAWPPGQRLRSNGRCEMRRLIGLAEGLGQLNAWELTMRAMPRALSINPASLGEALELLEQAMELAPTDALPVALAAWCHGHRSGHHFTKRAIAEKEAARDLAGRAAQLNTGDPVATALLAQLTHLPMICGGRHSFRTGARAGRRMRLGMESKRLGQRVSRRGGRSDRPVPDRTQHCPR